MVISFLLSAVVLVFAIFLPGYPLLRSMRFGKSTSLAAAPLITTSLYSVEAIVLAKAGIASSFFSICVPVFLLGLIVFAFKAKIENANPIMPSANPKNLPLFIIAGIAASSLFFLFPLGSLDAFVCANDNAHHFNLAMSFAESGNWSTLETTLTPGSPGSYYPSLWSLLCAIPVSLLGAKVTIAANALNFIIMSTVFPAGMYLLSSKVLKDDRIAIICCAILSFSFFGFPWEFLIRQTQLYPNLLAFALLPGFLAFFCEFFSGRLSKTDRIYIGITAFAGILSVALAHPNAIFTSLFFIYAYLAKMIVRQITASKKERGMALSVVCILGLTLAFTVAWVIFFRIPFLQDIVTCSYEPSKNGLEALLRALVLKSSHIGAQYSLVFLVACGCISCIANKNHRWLLVPFCLATICFVCNVCLPEGTVRNVISGFWYNHPTRTFASMTFYAMPIAALGAQSIILFIHKTIRKRRSPEAKSAMKSPAIPFGRLCILLAIMIASIFILPLPLPAASNGFDLFRINKDIHNPADKTSFYTQDERDFMDEVAKTTNGACVLNVPNDGSGYAYALNHVNVVGRSFRNEPDSNASVAAQVIDQVASSQSAKDLVYEMGIEYVVLLDSDTGESRTIYGNRFNEEQWKHILTIDETTPGFDLVLSENDMKLFRITARD